MELVLQVMWMTMPRLAHLNELEEHVQVRCVGLGHGVHHPLRHGGNDD